MIITRSPLRITLGGGGTDLPSYYRDHGGFVIAATIDRYVYVNVMRPFVPGVFLKYSKLEHVTAIDGVQHPIIREALRRYQRERDEWQGLFAYGRDNARSVSDPSQRGNPVPRRAAPPSGTGPADGDRLTLP